MLDNMNIEWYNMDVKILYDERKGNYGTDP